MTDLAPIVQQERTRPPCHAALRFDDAIARIACHVLPLPVETVRIAEAGGRVLAEPLRARVAAPRRAVAAMDGYAVLEADLACLPARLTIVGEALPGSPCPPMLTSGRCIRVFTGAPVPVGTDRVIEQERTSRDGDALTICEVADGRHVRRTGSDFAAGTTLLDSGRLLDPRALVVAAAADAATLRVHARPRVRIVAAGDELVAPGRAATCADTIPDSLSIAIADLARRWGAVPSVGPLLADDPWAIEHEGRAALADHDLLILIGGSSVGDRDYAKAGLAPLGLDLLIPSVAIKPGKPVWFGHIGGLPVLGLPGNPTAAMTTARLFLTTILCAMTGRPAGDALRWRPHPLAAALGSNGDREAFLCARSDDEGVAPLGTQRASAQHDLARSDMLIRRPPRAAALAAGACVMAIDF